MTFVLASLADRLEAIRPEVLLGLLVLGLVQVVVVLVMRARARRVRGNQGPLARPRPMSAPPSPPAPAASPAAAAPRPSLDGPLPPREAPLTLEPEVATGAEVDLGDRPDHALIPALSRRRPSREYMGAALEPRPPAGSSPARRPVGTTAVGVAVAPRRLRAADAILAGAAVTALAAALLLYLTRTRESLS